MGRTLILKETSKASVAYGRTYSLDIDMFPSEELIDLYEAYIKSELTRGLSKNTLRTRHTYLRYAATFFHNNEIYTLRDFNIEKKNAYKSFLNTTTDQKGKRLTNKTQYSAFICLINWIKWVQAVKPQYAIKEDISVPSEYRRINTRSKKEYLSADMQSKILDAVKNYDNPYVRVAVYTLLYNGLHTSEVLSLEVGCVAPTNIAIGFELKVYDCEKRINIAIPANNAVFKAVKQLEEYTASMRDDASDDDRNKLFIHRYANTLPTGKKGSVHPYSDRGLHDMLDKFVRDCNLVDENGDYIKIRGLITRRTTATTLIADGVSPIAVAKLLRHKNLKTTEKYYIADVDKSRADMIASIGVIGNIKDLPDKLFDSEEEREWFEEHKDREARLLNGYCTKQYSGTPCSHMSKNITCLTCVKYVTTPEYLDIHKARLSDLEEIVQEGQALYGKHYTQHFEAEIVMLKTVIERLEGMIK